jgi:DNA-directed RNA polymerase subunit N (RpoN/RPB10)
LVDAVEAEITPDSLVVFAFRVGQAASKGDKNAAYRAVDSLFDTEQKHGIVEDEEEIYVLNEHGLNHFVCERLCIVGVTTVGKLRSLSKERLTELYGAGGKTVVEKILRTVKKVSRR